MAGNFSRIYRETNMRLDIFSRRVQEGKDVMAASEFCRWLLFSGIIELLKANSNHETTLLKVDGSFIEWKTNDLLKRCNDFFIHGHPASVTLSAAYLQTLHEKIDLMAGYLSKLSVSQAVSVTPAPGQVQADSRVDGDGARVPPGGAGGFPAPSLSLCNNCIENYEN
jgi:hypothetical protein